MILKKPKVILALSMLFAVIMFKLMLFGSPVCRYFARNTVNAYISKNYPDCYIYGEISYSPFNLGTSQCAVIKSHTDKNFEIRIYTDFTGLTVNEKIINLMMN